MMDVNTIPAGQNSSWVLGASANLLFHRRFRVTAPKGDEGHQSRYRNSKFLCNYAVLYITACQHAL